jgi:hypothetical protein
MKLKVFLAAVALAVSAGAAHAATNLVVNGDFSNGDAGFTSGYRYVAPNARALMPEAVYTVTADPRSVHPYWVNLPQGNPMLIVNGATKGQTTVWQEALTTVAGQAYSFTASAMDVCCNKAHPGTYAASELLFEVSSDDFATFQTLTTINTAPPGDAGQFHTATATFTAAGAVEIRVIDALTGRVGNDFALDNIGVYALPDDPGHTPGLPNATVPSGVPEPASWALLILGFGGVGAALRSSRQPLATLRGRDAPGAVV